MDSHTVESVRSWRAWAEKAKLRWGGSLARCHGTECRSARLWQKIWRRPSGARFHGAWYCAPQCLEDALRQSFAKALAPVPQKPEVSHRIPLGLLLLSRGYLTEVQLLSALATQSRRGFGRLGYWLEELGFVTEPQITAALGLQWACPVLPPFAVKDAAGAEMIPFRLLEKFRMLPVRFVPATGVLLVAFSQGVDYSALYAIERVLACRTEPCLLRQSAMDWALERIAETGHPQERYIESAQGAGEMAHTTCEYVLNLRAGEVRIAACGKYVWVRLESAPGPTHLLFPRLNPALEEFAAPASLSRRRHFPKPTTSQIAGPPS